MKYILRRKILDSSFETTISKERFHQLLQAREGLFELLAIEEKYDLLIRSYLNFEKVINETTLNSLMITDSSWSDFIEHIQSANLAMMSLLTMCRSYIDHIPQHLESAFPNSTFEVESFDKVRKEVHAEILGYRALYAIRNHVHIQVYL